MVVAENKVEDGMEGNMGTECYALQVVHLVVEDNMVDIGDTTGGCYCLQLEVNRRHPVNS